MLERIVLHGEFSLFTVNYHKIYQNGARKSLHVQVGVAIFVTMVTMQPFAFYLNLHVGGRTLYIQK